VRGRDHPAAGCGAIIARETRSLRGAMTRAFQSREQNQSGQLQGIVDAGMPISCDLLTAAYEFRTTVVELHIVSDIS